ncbi:MAG: hypothetical protein M3Q06_04605 [Bacteroidota bacterium]|nr:hypothetical protein [Bacteroidota bacterium]
MRKTYLLLYIQFIFITAPAQTSINVGLSYGRGFSYTKYSPFTRASGFSAEFTKTFVPQMDIRFTAAWEATGPINYREQGTPSAFNSYDAYVVIPLRIGLQRYIHEQRAFVFGETGAGIGFFPYDKTGETNTRVNLSYALGGGYRHHFNERNYLQASLSYNRNPYKRSLPFSFSWVLFRVAYGLTWSGKK